MPDAKLWRGEFSVGEIYTLRSEDTQLLTKELCLVEVQADLLEQLHKAAKGSIRLITVGLSRIESFSRVQRWDKIDSQQWADRPFFFARQVDYNDE